MLKKINKVILVAILVMSLAFVGINQVEALDPADYDFEGETVKIMSWPWVDMFGEDADKEILERKELAEEKFNCTIEDFSVKWGTLVEDLTTRLIAGESEWDIWNVFSHHFWPLLGENALYPVGDTLPDDYYDDFWVSRENLKKTIGYKGQIYGFTDPFGPGRPGFLWWNKDMFEREGLPSLYDIYEEGNWTWDKMTELMEELTQDTDGDGETDRWGLGGLTRLVPRAAFSNNAPPFARDENGNLVYNMDSPEYREFVHQVRSWYEEGLYKMWGDYKELFAEGQIAMYYKSLEGVPREMDDDYGIVPFPKGPRADHHVYPAQGVYTNVIPINAENPEGLVALYNYIFVDTSTKEEREENIQEYIMEAVRDQKSYEIALEGIDNWEGQTLTLEKAIMVGDDIGENYRKELNWQPINGYRDVGSTMEEFKPIIQGHIDAILDQ